MAEPLESWTGSPSEGLMYDPQKLAQTREEIEDYLKSSPPQETWRCVCGSWNAIRNLDVCRRCGNSVQQSILRKREIWELYDRTRPPAPGEPKRPRMIVLDE
jgi:hypothetical protein